ncbi:28S ribosomal protein S15, mitochondrial isoform X1 [Perognathus longimembris pacificus]|uniref:28S ribosomal protein S15, mitochondrial isoform X1 n=1 Tax=Perognathus longimembris pacificus TaxID=214514 RepID=UPI00201983C9|nr:28S ribosomal protein S15, mitochondrial isoform X1 [Perognathus longimembris pacificus]
MLRAAWRALSSVRTHASGFGLPGKASARLPSAQWGLQPPSHLLQATRGHAVQKPIQPNQDGDPPLSTLLKDYQNVPGIDKVDDVVRRVLSLEMANKKEKLKVKQEQLMEKIEANLENTRSLEAQVVSLTVRIHSLEEHMQKHRQDKAQKRYLQMSTNKRKKLLTNLRKTNYDVFEKTCKELGIEYTLTPLYLRKAHRRLLTKKALCIRVFQEKQKLKKQQKALKAAAAAAAKQNQGIPVSPSKI